VDWLFGGDDADDLRGSFGDGRLDSEGGDDLLRGGHGDDELNGGEGNDGALFNGSVANYTLTRLDDGGLLVAHNDAGGVSYGPDRLHYVEMLDFGGLRMATG
jgi:Ca2+-binding RTX toxin-like protein